MGLYEILWFCFIALFSAGAHADFIVLTDFTQATPTATPSNALDSAKQSASLDALSSSIVLSWASAQPLTALNAYTSALNDLQSYVAKATKSYSIHTDVTGTRALVTFTSEPDWYAQAPADVKNNNEINVSLLDKIQQAIFSGVSVTSSATGASTGAAQPTTTTTAGKGSTAPKSEAASLRLNEMSAGMGLVGAFVAGVVLM